MEFHQGSCSSATGQENSPAVVLRVNRSPPTVPMRAKLLGVPAARIGTVGGDRFSLKTTAGEFSCPVAELHDPWWNSIARAMG